MLKLCLMEEVPPVEVRLLGPVELLVDGNLVELGGRSQRVVLSVLALRLGEVVAVDHLYEALWGHDWPERASANLQTYISRLRSSVGRNRIVRSGAGYRLLAEGVRVDVARARQLIADGRPTEARALWRGRVLEELDGAVTFEAERVRLAELRAGIEVAWLRRRVDEEPAASVLPDLEAAFTTDPTHPTFALLLAEVKRRDGRRAEALRVLDTHRRAVVDASGLDPSPDVAELEQRLLSNDDESPGDGTTPQSMTVGGAAVGLVTPTTRSRLRRAPLFLGRDEDLTALDALTDSAPLVTVVGPGGVGKTTLVAEWCASRAVVTVVELDRIGADEDVVLAVVSALDLGAVDVTTDAVVERLMGERGVVVLDNCEHVLTGVRRLVEELTTSCPELVIVATSRQMLGAANEWVVPLGPLSTTAVDRNPSDAVQVFLNRAQRIDPRYQPAQGELAAITSICRRLDGLPLAIELAASRTGALTVEEIDRHLDEALDLLADPANPRGRHQTLRATVAWSHDLLTPATKALLPKLSVFAGGFPADALPAMGGGLTNVGELVAGGLALRLDGGPASRYRLFEAARQFAAEQLVDGDEAFDELGSWIAGLADAAAADHGTEREVDAVARIRADLANVSLAVAWSLERDAHLAANLGTVLGRYAPFYGTAPMYDLIDQIADHDHIMQAERGPGAVAAAAHNAWMRGNIERAQALAERALPNLPDGGPDVWMVNFALSGVALRQGRLADSLEGLRLIENDGRASTWVKATAVSEAARRLALLGRREEAEDRIREAWRLAELSGSPSAIAHITMNEGGLSLFEDPAATGRMCAEAASLARRCGARALAVMAESVRVTALALVPSMDEVLRTLPAVLTDLRRHGSWSYLWLFLRAGAEALAHAGHHEPAARLLAVARADPSAPTLGVYADLLERSCASVRAATDDVAWARALADAESLSRSAVVELALTALSKAAAST